MQNIEIVQLLKKSKFDKRMTMNDIAIKSAVGIRTVNRIFTGLDARFSSMSAVLKTLDLNIHIDKKVA